MRRTMMILGVLVLLLPGSVLAQLLPSYGVKAGLNFSNIDLDDLESSNRTGMVGGLFVNLPFPGLNLQGEVLYTTKGFTEGTLTSASEIDFRMHDLQIPVLMKVSLPIPAVTPSLYVGPALSFRVKGEMKSDESDWVDVKDDLKSTSWSLIMGLDVKLFSTLIVDFRYDLGLSAINDTSLGDNLTELGKDIKDRTLTAMVGVAF
jgi:opacity protein-like surface antigen